MRLLDWRETLAPPEPSPDPLQFASRLHRRRARCYECRVDRSDRRPDQQVRPYASLEQGLEHSSLTRAETGPTGENKRSTHEGEDDHPRRHHQCA